MNAKYEICSKITKKPYLVMWMESSCEVLVLVYTVDDHVTSIDEFLKWSEMQTNARGKVFSSKNWLM